MSSGGTSTRVVSPGALEHDLAERIALFAVVNRHPRAVEVLAGLCGPARQRARALVTEARSWSSSKRQARATLEFGNRPDQHQRLAALLGEASPPLRAALYAQLSVQQQARFAPVVGTDEAPVAGRAALAARLVREASR